MDELTSALDAENEQLIEESLRSLPRETIVIVVSHRPSLLNRCNRFVAVQEGHVSVLTGQDDRLVERFVRLR